MAAALTKNGGLNPAFTRLENAELSKSNIIYKNHQNPGYIIPPQNNILGWLTVVIQCPCPGLAHLLCFVETSAVVTANPKPMLAAPYTVTAATGAFRSAVDAKTSGR